MPSMVKGYDNLKNYILNSLYDPGNFVETSEKVGRTHIEFFTTSSGNLGVPLVPLGLVSDYKRSLEKPSEFIILESLKFGFEDFQTTMGRNFSDLITKGMPNVIEIGFTNTSSLFPYMDSHIKLSITVQDGNVLSAEVVDDSPSQPVSYSLRDALKFRGNLFDSKYNPCGKVSPLWLFVAIIVEAYNDYDNRLLSYLEKNDCTH